MSKLSKTTSALRDLLRLHAKNLLRLAGALLSREYCEDVRSVIKAADARLEFLERKVLEQALTIEGLDAEVKAYKPFPSSEDDIPEEDRS